MCLVVKYSEKLVKSDYLGVIICIWWRKVKKIGLFATQNAKYTANSCEDPKNRDLPHKLHSLSILQAEYTEKSGHSCDFPKKFGKFIKLGIQLSSNLTNCS